MASADCGHDVFGVAVGHGVDDVGHRLPRGERADQLAEQRRFAREQPIQRGARHPGSGGELIHGQLRQPLAADLIERGVQDALPRTGFWRAARFAQQGLAAAEESVQGAHRDARGCGELVHGRLPPVRAGPSGGGQYVIA